MTNWIGQEPIAGAIEQGRGCFGSVVGVGTGCPYIGLKGADRAKKTTIIKLIFKIDFIKKTNDDLFNLTFIITKYLQVDNCCYIEVY